MVTEVVVILAVATRSVGTILDATTLDGIPMDVIRRARSVVDVRARSTVVQTTGRDTRECEINSLSHSSIEVTGRNSPLWHITTNDTTITPLSPLWPSLCRV